jgi:hypothetical protein
LVLLLFFFTVKPTHFWLREIKAQFPHSQPRGSRPSDFQTKRLAQLHCHLGAPRSVNGWSKLAAASAMQKTTRLWVLTWLLAASLASGVLTPAPRRCALCACCAAALRLHLRRMRPCGKHFARSDPNSCSITAAVYIVMPLQRRCSWWTWPQRPPRPPSSPPT